MGKELKVLISAYACEPSKGSEPGTGWNIVISLSRLHNVTVLTRTNNRAKIEAAQNIGQGRKTQFIYYDLPGWATRMKKLLLLPVPLYYALWQAGAYLSHKKQIAESGFDIVHHLTFNAFEAPGFFWLLPNHFILGPIGGGQTVSTKLLAEFGPGAYAEFLRNVRVGLSLRNPLVCSALRKAAFVLFANHDTQRLLGAGCADKSRIMVDVGVDASAFAPRARTNGEAFMVLYVGRLERRKGITLLWRALRQICKDEGMHCRIVGDGPMRGWLEKHLVADNLSRSVELINFCAHGELKAIFQTADVFVFPSLRDTTGSVVLEAMASGLPVVCLDHQGAAVMTSSDCAERISLSSPGKMAEEIVQAIHRLRANPARRQCMGRAGRARAERMFDWSAKALKLAQVYEAVAAETAAQLSFEKSDIWE